jgi:hypothetical protein
MKRSLARQRLVAVCGKLDEVVDRFSDAECVSLISSIASVVATASAPPPYFEAMSLTELLSFDKQRHDRKRAKRTFSLKAHDFWAADKSEAVEMVAALSGWCEVVVMWEALRVILAWDDERDQVVWPAHCRALA